VHLYSSFGWVTTLGEEPRNGHKIIIKMKKNFYIKKKVTDKEGKVSHTIMTDGSSQVWEFTDKEKITEVVKALNANTDSGCEYRVWQVQPLD
jgi:hypothetical protein